MQERIRAAAEERRAAELAASEQALQQQLSEARAEQQADRDASVEKLSALQGVRDGRMLSLQTTQMYKLACILL